MKKTDVYQHRLSEIRSRMRERELDSLLVLIEENRRYLSGFTGEDHQFDESAGALFITAKESLSTIQFLMWRNLYRHISRTASAISFPSGRQASSSGAA